MKTTKLFASILSAGLALCLFAGCAKDTTSDKDSPDVEEIEVIRTVEPLSGDAKQSENNGDWKVDLPQAQSQVTTTTKSAETQNKETTTTTKKSTIAQQMESATQQKTQKQVWTQSSSRTYASTTTKAATTTTKAATTQKATPERDEKAYDNHSPSCDYYQGYHKSNHKGYRGKHQVRNGMDRHFLNT